MEVVPIGSRIWKTSFIDPSALINGKLLLDGDFIYVAPFVQTDSSSGDIRIGEGTNIQDCAKIIGPAEVGSNVSVAHRAVIRNSMIGSFSFVGFGAEVIDSRVGAGAFIGHGARVNGLNIPEGGYVPPGARNVEGTLSDELREFKEEVLHVNSELVIGYVDLLYSEGERAVLNISPSPKTSWSPKSIYPKTDGVKLIGQCRIIGSVEFQGDSEVGDRTSLRGDEGMPIKIGRHVKIGGGVVFHSLKGEAIEVGGEVVVNDGAVIHGPARIGKRAVIGGNTILLRSRIADGEVIPDDSLIVDGARIR